MTKEDRVKVLLDEAEDHILKARGILADAYREINEVKRKWENQKKKK